MPTFSSWYCYEGDLFIWNKGKVPNIHQCHHQASPMTAPLMTDRYCFCCSIGDIAHRWLPLQNETINVNMKANEPGWNCLLIFFWWLRRKHTTLFTTSVWLEQYMLYIVCLSVGCMLHCLLLSYLPNKSLLLWLMNERMKETVSSPAGIPCCCPYWVSSHCHHC